MIFFTKGNIWNSRDPMNFVPEKQTNKKVDGDKIDLKERNVTANIKDYTSLLHTLSDSVYTNGQRKLIKETWSNSWKIAEIIYIMYISPGIKQYLLTL